LHESGDCSCLNENIWWIRWDWYTYWISWNVDVTEFYWMKMILNFIGPRWDWFSWVEDTTEFHVWRCDWTSSDKDVTEFHCMKQWLQFGWE